MSSDLENRLRNALRPVDPGEEFSRRVLASVERARTMGEETSGSQSRWPFVRRRLQWLSAALTASLVVAVVGAHLWQERHERMAGLAARQQLIEALRVTSEKLDLAYESVKPRKPDDEDTAHES